MNTSPRSPIVAKLARLLFLGILVVISCAAHDGPWQLTAAIVVAHLIGISVAVIGVSMTISHLPGRRFSIGQLLFATLGFACYLSLLRWQTRSVPFENLTLAGWVQFIVLATVVGWAIVAVLAEWMNGIVWLLVKQREKARRRWPSHRQT